MERKILIPSLAILILLACQTFMPKQTPENEISPTEALPTDIDSSAEETPTQPSDTLAGSPGIGDSLYPDFGNGGYDTKSYILDMTVKDVKTSDLTAVTTIEHKSYV